MITLYCFGANFGVYEPSPFTLKVDTFMRMAGLPFESNSEGNNLRTAPKDKLPYIDDEQKRIADSFFIIQHLQQNHPVILDDWLSEDQKAQAHLMCKSLDENFYWCIVHSRWVHDETWKIVKQAFFGNLPFPMNTLIPMIVRRGVKRNLHGHGLGRHSEKEILNLAQASLNSMSQLLGEKPYIFGNKPCSLDATIYAFLAQVILTNIDNALTHKAREYANLVQYCERIQQQYYPS